MEKSVRNYQEAVEFLEEKKANPDGICWMMMYSEQAAAFREFALRDPERWEKTEIVEILEFFGDGWEDGG